MYDKKNCTCFKCWKSWHTAKYCQIKKKKKNRLELDEKTVKKLELLLNEASSETEKHYGSSEEELQIDEIATTSDS